MNNMKDRFQLISMVFAMLCIVGLTNVLCCWGWKIYNKHQVPSQQAAIMAGWNNGFERGMEKGFSDGRTEGLEEGYGSGYSEGFKCGTEYVIVELARAADQGKVYHGNLSVNSDTNVLEGCWFITVLREEPIVEVNGSNNILKGGVFYEIHPELLKQ